MDLIPSRPLSHEVTLFDDSGVNLPCVGSIISSYLILTLASCLHGNGQEKGWSKFSIKTKSGNGLDSNLKLEEEQIKNISQIFFHPDSTNDLAILVLDQNLNLSVKILPVLSIFNGTADESISKNFSGRFCGEDSELSALQISESSHCPFYSAKSDKFCLLPVDSNAKNSSCSSPLAGSSLICSDEKHGQFLCGILAISPKKVGRENGQIYKNITRHLKWIESVSAEFKAQAKINVKESNKLNKKEQEDAISGLSVGDYDYENSENVPDFEERTRKTRNVDYDVGRHIAQGMSVNKTDPIPYQLSIRYNANLSDGEWEHICGAVILDEETAITAAHCFDKTKDASHYHVVAGENRLYRPDAEEQVLPLKKAIIHPEYTYFTDGNDIAILHVDRFRFNKFVGGVWLSPFSNKKLQDKTAVVSGWGDVSHTSGLSIPLQKGNVSILPPEDCLNRLSNRMKNINVREGVLCALDPLIRTCTGDSGGPLVMQNYTLGNSTGNLLVGITSFGARNCSHLNRVGVFTEISSFYNWIQENRATPLGCGGFIKLNGEKEIVYKVPEELHGQKSVCVWVVAAVNGSKIEMELLSNPENHFQPEESTLFAIYDFQMNASIHSKMLGKDEKCTIDQPFFVLYFRTNSSGPNSGFHILLKEAGENQMQTNVTYLELGLTDGASSPDQEFDYSRSPASEYANDERTFIIVKPGARHRKMELDLKSVITENWHDWVQITSVKSEPVSSFRFSGENWWSDNYFESEEHEPFIIYFHFGSSTTKFGFKFSYSEQSKSAYKVNRRCGGFINLDLEHDIIYKVPSEDSDCQRGSICLWIVSTGRKDVEASIQATILNNPSAQFNPDSDVIFATYNFTIDKSQYKTINAVGASYTIPAPFMTLYYRTTSFEQDAGFHLKLKDLITQSNITERLNVKLIPLPNADSNEGEIQEFSYPSSVSSASKYSSNERTFFILKPQKPGAKIRVNLTFVDTQAKHDWLEINSYRAGPTPLERFNGQRNWTEMILEGLEDQPVFFYFHSDQSDEKEGFKIHYYEIVVPNSSCGGFIRLRGEYGIVYKVPEELQGENIVCVWVVEARGANSIEMEVLSNPKVPLQPEKSILLAIYNFTINADSHSKILIKYKTMTVDHPFFVLYFRSNSSAPNSGFHIHLKEAGEQRWQKAVKYLELTGGATSAVQEFKYPLPPASEYKDDERTFIIVKPGARQGKLELEMKSVSTEENSDWVEVLSVKSKPVSHFRFSGEKSWSEKDFEAEEGEPWMQIMPVESEPFSIFRYRFRGEASWSGNYFEAEEAEPFIVYFQSGESNTRAGFNFSYSEHRKTKSPVNRCCGGFINLDQSPEQEIIYKVPSEEPERQLGSICVWIVSTGRKDNRASIQATILNDPSAQFNPDSDVIFATYNFTINNSQYKIINQTGTKYTIRGPFITLLYRSTSSEQNAGFHIKLKDSITQSNITERLDVKLITVPNADLNKGEIQEFSFPSSVSGVPNSNSSGNERAFLILKPQKPGARITVNLKFLDTQENQYFLKINTHEVRPTPRARFYGTGNWTDKTFFGDEDEPFILYFHSDPGNVTTGFKISYFEIPKISICGGFIELEKEREIIYQIPAPEGENQTSMSKTVCVWIIANKRGESMEATILNDPVALFHPAQSQLIGLKSFESSFLNELILEKNTTYEIDSPLMALYFRSTSNMTNAGFHLRLRNPDYENGEEQPGVKDIRITSNANATKFSYPFSNDTDKNRNQSQLQFEDKVFVILEPSEMNMSVQVNLEGLEIEDGGGWLALLMYSENHQILEIRYKTTIRGQINKQFESKKGEPLILYFHSYASAQPKPTSFKFTHSEKT